MPVKTAVITGASGFIGTNIMLRLLREGIRIVAVYHRKQPKYIDDRITWVQADLSKSEERYEEAGRCPARDRPGAGARG